MKTKKANSDYVTVELGPVLRSALLAYFDLHSPDERNSSENRKLESALFWACGMALSMPETLCRATRSAIDYRAAEGVTGVQVVIARVAEVDWKGRLPYSDGYEDKD